MFINQAELMTTICTRVDQVLILGMVIPPLTTGNLIKDISNPTIGLMTIPYHKEPMGVHRPSAYFVSFPRSSDFAVVPHSQPEDAAPTDQQKK